MMKKELDVNIEHKCKWAYLLLQPRLSGNSRAQVLGVGHPFWQFFLDVKLQICSKFQGDLWEVGLQMLVQGRGQFFTEPQMFLTHLGGCVQALPRATICQVLSCIQHPIPFKLGFNCCLWPYCIFPSIPCTIWMEPEFMFPSRFWF